MTAEPALRVGLLVDGDVQPAWVHRIVTKIQASDIADIVLVVENCGRIEGEGSALGRLRERPDLFLYWLYTKSDEFLFRPRHHAGRARLQAPAQDRVDDAFASMDIGPLVAGAARLRVRPRQTKFSDYLEDADVEAIRSHRLDVALRFGFRILRGRVLDIARYGVWSYHHADNRVNRGGPAGFWEVFERSPVTGSVLQVLTEDLDAGLTLYRSYARTDRFSVARNRANYFWTASEFVPRMLREVQARGADALSPGRVEARAFTPYSGRLYTRPGNREMTRLLARHALRVVGERLDGRLRPAQWVLAYQLRSGVPALHRFRYLTPPADRFWADPFPVARDGRFYVFCEEYVAARDRGHIAVIEMDAEGGWVPPHPVLELPHHVSYPFVFEWRGTYYMVPESEATRRVELYRCVDFPHKWEPERVLLDGVRALDATLVERDGRWWMFVHIAVEGATDYDDELHLFMAQTPLGPWQPHPGNPVKSDVRSSRPAGRIFCWGDDLVRPAQDGGARYGSAITFQRVTRLDEWAYAEVEMARIEPKWDRGLLATHTFNMVPGLTVVDVLRRRPTFGRRT